MNQTITTSTKSALDAKLLDTIRTSAFCIVGCGAVGAAFAEMLVRTGATKITLIDGDKVECKNLNRVIGFFEDDIGKMKVDVLTNHLKRIKSDIDVVAKATHFCEKFPGESAVAEEARFLIRDAGVVVMAMDSNSARIQCEKYCSNTRAKNFMSVGVFIDKKSKVATYECTWHPATPAEKQQEEGYGPANASYASIVLEATAAGFQLLLHCLQNAEKPEYTWFTKTYRNFLPTDWEVK